MALQVASVAVPYKTEVAIPEPTHVVFVIDCSGSMYRDLGDIAKSLKNKLPQLINVGDLVSIVWFSGRGDYGVLQEAVEVRSLTDFSRLNKAIDQYLRPIGLTGFKEPLMEVVALVERTKRQHPGHAVSLFFHTDGMDNQWSSAEIYDAVRKVSAVIDSASIVEYGWYCNRNLLTVMAELLSGQNLFAKEFDELDSLMQAHMARRAATKKVLVNVPASAERDYAYTIGEDGAVTVYSIKGGEVAVPEGTKTVYYLTSARSNGNETYGAYRAIGEANHPVVIGAYYAALYLMAQRMDTDGVFDLLASLGDVAYIRQFGTCFSKQDYANFQTNVQAAITSPLARLTQGQDFNAVPKDDAYTILDLLSLLASDEGNKFHPHNAGFKYERMSRRREAVGDTLSADDKARLIAEVENAAGAGDLASVKALIDQISEGKVVIKSRPINPDGGYPISLTWTEDRPNINMLVRIPVAVDLPPTSEWVAKGILPAEFTSYIYRNYNVVNSGIKHTSMLALPFELTHATFQELQDQGVIAAGEVYVAGRVYTLDADLPVINRQMVKNVSAKAFFTQAVRLLQAKAKQKVLDYFYKASFERVSINFEARYGAEATAWLKTVGITEHNGFAPPSKSVEPTDEYTAKAFEVKIAKCSSLPTVKAVLDKRAAGKALTISEQLLVPAIEAHEAFMASSIYLNAANQESLYRTWIESETAAAKADARRLTRDLAKGKFTIIVGHVWFSEFASLDENSMDVEVDGTTYSVSAYLTDVTIKI